MTEGKENEELRDIMYAISQRFQPVPTIKESNMSLSTAEFLEKIREHYPLAEYMTDADMYQLLKQMGYTYQAVGTDAKLEWLIHKI